MKKSINKIIIVLTAVMLTGTLCMFPGENESSFADDSNLPATENALTDNPAATEPPKEELPPDDGLIRVEEEIYSGKYLDTNGILYNVSQGIKGSTVTATLVAGSKYYDSKSSTYKTLSSGRIYQKGELYSGYYVSSAGKMYKVKSGAYALFSGTLAKGTAYARYKSTAVYKLSAKITYYKGCYANRWIKKNGTWCYYNYKGQISFKSNVMYKAWSKIKSNSSKTKYYIVVDRDNTRTMIFKGSKNTWVPYKLWLCSPGKKSTPTPKGSYTIKAKGYSFGRGYTCYYYTQFKGDYLFHSVLYKKGTRKILDGRLGKKLSHGCVRLSISNAKWIYKYIPRGTKLLIY